MNLSDLQREAHAIAKDHGWWDPKRTFGDCIANIHEALSDAAKAYRGLALGSYVPPAESKRLWGSYGAKPEGVVYELADVVIRVADIAEDYGWVVAPGTTILDQNHLDYCLDGLESFGDWISRLHWFVACAYDHRHGQACDEVVVEHFFSLVIIVQAMAAHYGIDLDAAIAAKMEYYRGAGQ